jgi:hypothetical protein
MLQSTLEYDLTASGWHALVQSHEDSIPVTIEAAKAFGKIGLEHYVLEWCFEGLETCNPRYQRQRALQVLVSMAETFPTMESVAAFLGYVRDEDLSLAQVSTVCS